jgi:hypothetical protein
MPEDQRVAFDPSDDEDGYAWDCDRTSPWDGGDSDDDEEDWI